MSTSNARSAVQEGTTNTGQGVTQQGSTSSGTANTNVPTPPSVQSAINALKGGVGEDGDTLNKLRTLIQAIQDWKQTIQDWKQTLTTRDTDNIINTIHDITQAFENIPEGAGKVLELLNQKINTSDIVNNLESEATNQPLSANMGRKLHQDGLFYKGGIGSTDFPSTDLNTYRTTGIYHGNNEGGSRLQHCPVNTNKFKLVIDTRGNLVVQVIYTHDQHLRGRVNLGQMWYRIEDTQTPNSTRPWGAWKRVINHHDVIDGLTSTATNQPLSANQGRILYENKMDKSAIVDNMGTASTTRPLSAMQGKWLFENKADRNHNHDDRYYTQSRLDQLVGGKVTQHNHTAQFSLRLDGRNVYYSSAVFRGWKPVLTGR